MKNTDYIKTQGPAPTHVGGQALVEGVMMRGKTMYSMAVRGPNKDIIVENTDIVPKKNSFVKWPIVRGVFSFVDSMVLGMKIITRSAELAGMEEYDEEPGKFEKFITDKLGDKLNDVVMFISVVLALGLSVGLFMLLPVWIGSFFGKIPVIAANSWVLGIIEGLVRLVVFVSYVFIISMNKDIHRVYQYHGAEHKTINCVEHGEELTVENVVKYSRYHRRCGTSFLLFVMIISMIFFLFVRTNDPLTRVFSRILFVPLIAGVSYEVIRWAGKSKSKFVEIVSWPGLKLQGLTTKEPEPDQIECAIAAMNTVLAAEQTSGEVAEPSGDLANSLK